MSSELLTAAEAATSLQVSARRVRALIEAGRLPARRATPAELAVLLEAGRIKAVTPKGLQVIQEADLELVKHRPAGYPLGRARRPRFEDTSSNTD
jgi:hypothetical protein